MLLWGLIFSCSSLEKKPKWIEGKTREYPSSRYLIGVGRAKASGNPAQDQLQAEQNARAELARQIRTKIKSRLSIRAEEELNRLGAEQLFRFAQEVRSSVVSQEELVLEGVEIARRYYDSKEQVYYALAVLDRKKVCPILEQKISNLSQELENYLKLAKKKEEEKDLLSCLSFLLQAKNRLKKLINLQAEGQVICGQFTRVDFSMADLIVKESELRNSIKVMVLAFEENPYQPESRVIESHLFSLLSSYGFSVVPAPEKLRLMLPEEIQEKISSHQLPLNQEPDYFLLGSFELNGLSLTQIGSHFYHFFLVGGRLDLIDFSRGEVLISIYQPEVISSKVGRTSPQQAVLKSLSLAGEYFANQLSQRLEEKYQIEKLGK